MQEIETPIAELVLFEPRVFVDERGYFFESYNKSKLPEGIRGVEFVQDNEAYSKDKGVLRGFHYQTGAYVQAKLVRVIRGAVYDVVIDIRPGSATYGQWFGAVLSENNKLQMFVPRGFAHAYLVLEADTIFAYKCDNYYEATSEGGIAYNDPSLKVDWEAYTDEFILSEKDKSLPFIENCKPIY